MRNKFALLFLMLLLPSAASAAVLSLYSAFDPRHPANSGYHHPKVDQPPDAPRSDVTGSVSLPCGRGRVRDMATNRCRGPADLR